MKITILAVGKIKREWLRKGIQEYRDRISKFQPLEIEEIPDSPEASDLNRVLALEGGKILSAVKKTDYLITLDPNGKHGDSGFLAGQVRNWLETGKSGLVFVIGGSNGLSKEVLDRADENISLSRLTFPHQLTRLIFLEQLYRCLKMNRGEKYHK